MLLAPPPAPIDDTEADWPPELNVVAAGGAELAKATASAGGMWAASSEEDRAAARLQAHVRGSAARQAHNARRRQIVEQQKAREAEVKAEAKAEAEVEAAAARVQSVQRGRQARRRVAAKRGERQGSSGSPTPTAAATPEHSAAPAPVQVRPPSHRPSAPSAALLAARDFVWPASMPPRTCLFWLFRWAIRTEVTAATTRRNRFRGAALAAELSHVAYDPAEPEPGGGGGGGGGGSGSDGGSDGGALTRKAEMALTSRLRSAFNVADRRAHGADGGVGYASSFERRAPLPPLLSAGLVHVRGSSHHARDPTTAAAAAASGTATAGNSGDVTCRMELCATGCVRLLAPGSRSGLLPATMQPTPPSSARPVSRPVTANLVRAIGATDATSGLPSGPVGSSSFPWPVALAGSALSETPGLQQTAGLEQPALLLRIGGSIELPPEQSLPLSEASGALDASDVLNAQMRRRGGGSDVMASAREALHTASAAADAPPLAWRADSFTARYTLDVSHDSDGSGGSDSLVRHRCLPP